MAQILHSHWCQVRLLNGPIKQKELTAENIQYTLGKFRWLQQTFGLSVSSDVFQERLDTVIKKVTGGPGISNDVLAKKDHETKDDAAVLSLLEKLETRP